MSQRYAFLPHLPKSPKRAAKEILRPVMQFRSRRNLYRRFAFLAPTAAGICDAWCGIPRLIEHRTAREHNGKTV